MFEEYARKMEAAPAEKVHEDQNLIPSVLQDMGLLNLKPRAAKSKTQTPSAATSFDADAEFKDKMRIQYRKARGYDEDDAAKEMEVEPVPVQVAKPKKEKWVQDPETLRVRWILTTVKDKKSADAVEAPGKKLWKVLAERYKEYVNAEKQRRALVLKGFEAQLKQELAKLKTRHVTAPLRPMERQRLSPMTLDIRNRLTHELIYRNMTMLSANI